MSRYRLWPRIVLPAAAFMLLYVPGAQAQVARDFGGTSVALHEPAAADAQANGADGSADTAGPKQTPPMPSSSTEELMTTKFYQALNDVQSNNFTGAAQKLRAVRGLSQKQGFTGLPDYSIELIRRAQSALGEQREQAAKFLVAQAVELSPKHPRINLLAASFYGLTGIGAALSALGKAAAALPSYPIMLGTILLNCSLAALVAMTVAFLIMCVIQLLRGGELIMVEAAKPFPKTLRGIAGAVILPVILIFPLKGGILAALAVWALVLSYFKKGCRWLALLTGLIILAWGAGIPLINTVGFNAESELYAVLEDINNGGFSPTGENLLFDELRKQPDNPQLLFTAAQAMHRRGLEFAASGLYQEVQGLTSERSDLYSTASLNLGALYYRDRRLEEAKSILESLEKRRVESFELYYDLALVHLALLDTANHREYYNKARAYDRSRLDALVVGTQDEARVMLGKLPSSALFPLLTRAPMWVDSGVNAEMLNSQQRLAASLVSGGSVGGLVVFGLSVAVLGLLVQLRWSKKKRKRATISFSRILEPGRSSILWCALPAGMSLAGNRPVRGTFLLGLVLALIMIAFEAPMRLYSALPVEVSFSYAILGLALILMLLSVAWSLALRRDGEELR